MPQLGKLSLLSILLYFFTFSFLTFPYTALAEATLFTDDFSTPIATNWEIQGAPGWNIVDGKYGIYLNPGLSNTFPIDTVWNYGWSNIAYDVDLTGLQGVDKNILVKFKDSSNFIELHANGNGIFLDKSSALGGGGLQDYSSMLLSNNVPYHFRFEIRDNGNIKVFINGSLLFDVNESLPLISNWKIGLRAGTGAVSPTEVRFDNVVVTQLDTTPPPTPTPDPTPTPTPTPTPVTKVIFAPGFGGSWNADAILNCHPDPDPSHWSLASYAESAYNPILSTLVSSGWNLKPFFYDWRALVESNSNSLNNVVNNFATAGEKVNIVGHSMGGLVSAGYLQNTGSAKTNSLLTVGSPLKGVPQAYPAWSGGDIWEDNFLTKIAMNLYLRRCGGFLSNRVVIQDQIPSIQNLLPVFDYIKKENILKPVGSMANQNGWLPINIPSDFWGIKFGTLTGTGFTTLAQVPVKDPNPKDIKVGNWLDGKPFGKTISSDGDGTALLSSTKVDEAHNVTINQNHEGLVNSVQGMAEILNFLGTSPASVSSLISTSEQPNSSLIIIGYPANFWVTDGNGNTKKDKDGMISFNNPESGIYKLSLLPKSQNTLFIVMQLLPNGQVFYKEYNLPNFLPKLKTLKFDINTPKEDLLN
ncbi:MAG TPA: hypothetical protein VFI61_01790 [Patescibacteria group bacterium]|nr:hypothetical protein [Patescibacteria group bacterium]